jgi:hypothetical protein
MNTILRVVRHGPLVLALLAVLVAFAMTAPAVPANAATTLTVINGNDSGAGSLRDQIAGATAGDKIVFDSSVTTILLTSGALSISKALTISGPGAGLLTIDGNASSRIFDISDEAVTIEGLTVTNGSTVTGGGGILSTDATLTLLDVAVTTTHASYWPTSSSGI